jgi:hypothetical protein
MDAFQMPESLPARMVDWPDGGSVDWSDSGLRHSKSDQSTNPPSGHSSEQT